jgi:hypothetical protein
MRQRRRHLIVALVQIALVGGAAARAWCADPQALVERGLELRRTHRDAEALKLFQEAYEIERTPRILIQIGLAQQALGRWGPADRHLRQSLESIDDPWIRKNRATIEASLKAIKRHIAHLDVTGTPVGAEVRVDGELVGRLPLDKPIAVAAGDVAIELRASGYLSIVRATTVPVGTLVRESFDLQSTSPAVEPERSALSRSPATSDPSPRVAAAGASGGGDAAAIGAERGAAAAPGSPASPPRSLDSPPEGPGSSAGRLRSIVVWGAAGLALVTLAVAIVEHISWQNKVSSFETMGCDRALPQRGGAACEPLFDDGQRARTLAFVGYGLTAGLVATAAIVHLTAQKPAAEPAKLACTVAAPAPGIICGLRF